MSATETIETSGDALIQANQTNQGIAQETAQKSEKSGKMGKSMSGTAKLLIVIVIAILVVIVFMMLVQEHLEQKNFVNLQGLPKPLFGNWNVADGSGNVVTFSYRLVNLTPAQKMFFKGSEQMRSDVLRDKLISYARSQKLVSADGKSVVLDGTLRGLLGVSDGRKQVNMNRIADIANEFVLVNKLPGGKVANMPLSLDRAFVNAQNGNINVIFRRPSDRQVIRYVLRGNMLHTVGDNCPRGKPDCMKLFAKKA
jgi:hypothetical protein